MPICTICGQNLREANTQKSAVLCAICGINIREAKTHKICGTLRHLWHKHSRSEDILKIRG